VSCSGPSSGSTVSAEPEIVPPSRSAIVRTKSNSATDAFALPRFVPALNVSGGLDEARSGGVPPPARIVFCSVVCPVRLAELS
jgi:hypothetical protein